MRERSGRTKPPEHDETGIGTPLKTAVTEGTNFDFEFWIVDFEYAEFGEALPRRDKGKYRST